MGLGLAMLTLMTSIYLLGRRPTVAFASYSASRPLNGGSSATPPRRLLTQPMAMDLRQVPVVSDRDRSADLYSRMLRGRVLFLTGELDDQMGNLIATQLLYLAAENAERDVLLCINSTGGSATAGLCVYDAMQLIKPDVATLCMGQASSMAAFILAGGAKGKRYALPHARVMIHQPLGGGLQGQASDIQIHAREVQAIKDTLNQLLAKHTGRPLDVVERDTDRDNYMSAPEALAYGLIDCVCDEDSSPL
eukprot:EG_transcript_13736